MDEILYQVDKRKKYLVRGRRRFTLVSSAVYGSKQKRGMWEWILLIVFTPVIFACWMMPPTLNGARDFVTSVVMSGLWLLLVFRRLRRRVSVWLFWNIAALSWKIQKMPFPEIRYQFYENQVLRQTSGNEGREERIFYYTSFEKIVKKRDAIYLFGGPEEGEVFFRDEFIKGNFEKFEEFVHQKMQKTEEVETYRLSGDIIQAQGENISNTQPLYQVVLQMDEDAIRTIADYMVSAEEKSIEDTKKKFPSWERWLAYLIVGLFIAIVGIRSGEIIETILYAVIPFVIAFYVSKMQNTPKIKEEEHQKKMKKISQKLRESALSRGCRYDFFEDRFYMETSMEKMSFFYADVNSVQKIPQGLILTFMKNRIIFLREDWFTRGTIDDFLIMIQEKIGQKK